MFFHNQTAIFQQAPIVYGILDEGSPVTVNPTIVTNGSSSYYLLTMATDGTYGQGIDITGNIHAVSYTHLTLPTILRV